MTIDLDSTRSTRAKAEPEFLVMFEGPSEDNAQALAEALDLEPANGELAQAGIRSMSRRKSHTPSSGILLDDVAVAAVDLTEDERERLERNPRISVVRNERRRRPPPISERGASSDDSSAGLPNEVTPLESYLEGVRDTTDLLLRRLRSERGLDRHESTSSTRLSIPTTGELTWAVRMVLPNGTPTDAGSGIAVAVLDTGIDVNHPDFAGRLKQAHLQSFVPGGASVQDRDGHGTHCAGVIGARHDVRPRFSVAPGCDLLIGKVLGDDGSGYDRWILEGIQWAVRAGAKIISMSLGSERAINEPFSKPYENIARRMLPMGVLVVAAAGNSSRRRTGFIAPVENPAAAPSILAVAAIDSRRKIADFSCGQRDFAAVDIAAPGVDVYSCVTNGQHARYSGTSMAAPHVAAVAAVLASRSPSLRGSALWQALVSGGELLPGLPPTDVGAGLAVA
jgi:subtilisin family serine protease